LLKLGGNIKDAMLDWLGGCLHANAGIALCLFDSCLMALLLCPIF